MAILRRTESAMVRAKCGAKTDGGKEDRGPNGWAKFVKFGERLRS